MKKITLLALLAVVAFTKPAFGQTVSISAPEYNGDWSALIGPNGYQNSATSPTTTYAYNRACYLITQAELTRMIATNSVITDFGFDFIGTHNVPITGSFTLYMANTADVTYNAGTTFSSIIPTMQVCYNSNMTLPGSTSSATNAVSIPLSSSFTWTGGGIYVAWDWHAATNTATTYARYLSSYDGVSMGANAMGPAAGPAPATLTVDVRRPSMRFRAVNTATNEIGVASMAASGLISKLAPSQTISAIVFNNSYITKTNIPVTLSVTGANSYNNTQNIATLAPGATTQVNFTGFNATTNGLNSMTLTVPSDQYNFNNGFIWTQTVNCTDFGNCPPAAASNYSDASYGYGSPAIICTPIHATGNYSMAGVKYAPSQTPNGSYSLCAVLLDAGGNILAMTNTLSLSAASFGTYANFKFTPPYALTSGTDYYYGIAQLTGGVYPLGTQAVLATQNLNLYYYAPIAGGAIGNAQNQMGYLGLEAVYGFSATTIVTSASNTLVCKSAGTTVTLTASGPSSFTWTPINQTGSVVVVTPTVSGQSGNVNYNVTGTDAVSGCKSAATIISVSVAASPTVNISATQTLICGTEMGAKSITLTANGTAGTDYTWAPTGDLSNQVIVTPSLSTPSGTIAYTVVGSNSVTNCQSNVASITISVSLCTGINSNGLSTADLKLFPNPSVNGKVTVNGLTGTNMITVFNTLGQVVLTKQVSEETADLDLSGQPSGNYLIKIMDANKETRTIKLINQN